MPVRVNKVNAGAKDICNPTPAPVRGYIKPHFSPLYHYYPQHNSHTTTTHPGEQLSLLLSCTSCPSSQSLCGDPNLPGEWGAQGPSIGGGATYIHWGSTTCPNDQYNASKSVFWCYCSYCGVPSGLGTRYIHVSGMCCRKGLTKHHITTALKRQKTSLVTICPDIDISYIRPTVYVGNVDNTHVLATMAFMSITPYTT